MPWLRYSRLFFNQVAILQANLSIFVRDAIRKDLDTRTSLLIVERFGQEFGVTPLYRTLKTLSEQILVYSYAVKNISSLRLEQTFNFARNLNMLRPSKSYETSKQVKPG